MRVIVLNDSGFVNGGAAQVAITGLNALAAAGLDVTFVSSVAPIDPFIDRNNVKVLNFEFYDLLGNPSRMAAAYYGIWDRRCAKRFGDILGEFDPADTIIHLHSWVNSLSSSVVRVALRRGFKIVCTLHDYFTVCPNGGIYNYQEKKQCNLRPMSLACLSTHCDSRSYGQKLWRAIRQAVQRYYGLIPGGIENFIAVSDYSQSLLSPCLPRNAKFFRVNNPIDIEKTPASDPSNNREFTFIGRFSPEKGVTVFANAAQFAGVRAVFVGSGRESRTISALNPNAILCDWQDRAGVNKAIRSSRAIVFPSLWHETQGLVVMEAAALGVPCVVSDACAARDSIVDGVSGFLFRAGDPNDLAAKLVLLQRNPQLAISLGKKAYDQYWRSPCTREKHVKELISCYAEIMGSKVT